MRSWIADRYGAPAQLQLADLPVPEVPDEGVLVRVRAASVNALDWHLLRGQPYLARATEGVRRPKDRTRGVDLAGVVEAVGRDVTHLRVGDPVVGIRRGAFGELVAGRNFVKIPPGIDFVEAAALPTAGLTALQGLRDKAAVATGDRVLVVGAGGGVGHLAVQIARSLGAEVTAATRTDSVSFVDSLGAARVVDYSSTDVLDGRETFDVVFDVGGERRLRHLRRATARPGRVVLAAPAPGNWIGPVSRMLWAPVSTLFSKRRATAFIASTNVDDLTALTSLVAAGQLRPAIDRVFAFEQTPEAIAHLEAGGVRGKVVIEL